MAEHTYDVTNPGYGIRKVYPTPKKFILTIYFLSFTLLILSGFIVHISFFAEYCHCEQKNESFVHLSNKEQITTEAISTEDFRIMESTSKIPSRGTDDNLKNESSADILNTEKITTEATSTEELRTMEPTSEIPSRITDDDLENNTCNTIECLHTAAHILSSMDLTMSPCENFYEYACGNMDSQKEEVLDIFAPNLYNDESLPNFLKKFRKFYESCIIYEDKIDYEKRLDTTKALLNRVGSFYVPEQQKKDLNITQLIANLILYKAMPLFDINIDIDAENTYIMKLLMPDQTSLKLGHWHTLSETKRKCLQITEEQAQEEFLSMNDLYNGYILCSKNYADYVDSISIALWELKFFSNLTENAIYKILFDSRTFMEFEILSKFDQIPLPPDLQEQYIKRQFEEIKIRQLEKEFPVIDWEYLFTMISNKTISGDTKIQMYNRDYFEDVFEQISILPREKLNGAFLETLVSNLYVNTVLPSHRHSRVKYCQERSGELMPDIVNYLYKLVVKTEKLEKQNADIKIIYDVLKERFRNSLQTRSWLDDPAKDSMLKKLDKIQLIMFENRNIQSEEEYLEEAYTDIELARDNYQSNLFNLVEFRKRRLLSLHGKKVSDEDMLKCFNG